MSIDKYAWIKITPLKMAKSDLIPGTKMISYGYVLMPDVIKNEVTVKSYTEYRTIGDSPILSCSGKAIYGLSGGPLALDGEVYGIQSSGGEGDVLYCPSDQILKFLGD